jgi:hypothetical protein
MEELHTDSIDGGHEASHGNRSRARERAYSNSYLTVLGVMINKQPLVINIIR